MTKLHLILLMLSGLLFGSILGWGVTEQFRVGPYKASEKAMEGRIMALESREGLNLTYTDPSGASREVLIPEALEYLDKVNTERYKQLYEKLTALESRIGGVATTTNP